MQPKERIPNTRGVLSHTFPSERTHLEHHDARGDFRAVRAHIANPENVTSFSDGRKCGDGRYEGLDGKLSRFGGDAGYVLALLGLNRSRNMGLSIEQIANTVIGLSDGKFSIHSDEVAEAKEDLEEIGCGHLAKAALPENANLYNVHPGEVREAIAYINRRALEDPNTVEKVILRGKHRERGVILNMGMKHKIRHGDGINQWFVVGVAREEEYAKSLFDRLTEHLPQLPAARVGYEQFREFLDMQTEATAKLLASGLPVFKVNLDGGLPFVRQAPSF